ncbi:MAG: PhzF family phenazine biosynthesis isomerase [Alphaproteobacteria bacterium]|nr:PhzF family phenazine biosynthesis isomerase [Alphaproteobacteria bacterium]
MDLQIFQVDAFAERPFEGNPAAVVPLHGWLDASVMQKIATENNLSETAFFVQTGEGQYDLRWFTPTTEVPLCGHATLASAWVIFNRLAPGLERVDFLTKSGVLTVERAESDLLAMSLPAYGATPKPIAYGEDLAQVFGRKPVEVFSANYSIAVFGDETDIAALDSGGDLPNVLVRHGELGVIATAKGGKSGFDFVSRFFVPGRGVAEDPVTGAAHAALVPFWARRLGKERMRARQMSPRGGNLICELHGERVVLKGHCAPFLTGTISI